MRPSTTLAMQVRHLALAIFLPAILVLASACDSKPKTDPAAEAKAKADADAKAKADRKAERKAEWDAKVADEKKKEDDIKAKILEISTIPEGTKLPKKIADACEQVVTAQSEMMKKFYPQVDDAALTTQLGMLRGQCIKETNIEVVMCQKFAIDGTTEDLKSMINEYLPTCMAKYGEPAPEPAPAAG